MRRNLAKASRDYEELREIEADIREFKKSKWGRENPIDAKTKKKSWDGWNSQMESSVNGLTLDKQHRKQLIKEAGLKDIED